MKKLGMILAMALALAFAACGDDDKDTNNTDKPGGNTGEKENDCAKAGKVVDVMGEFCKGKSDECWPCDCYNQDKALDVSMDMETFEMAYSCKAPEPVEEPVEEAKCEGEALAWAEECLADQAACKQTMIDSLVEMCDVTPKR
ncbi:MAG: hypothetical protein FWC28_02230 [Proteobacteria bacterium]|nr:hypothetical protein [Cystobacterineae bacterium]MCL2259179.1 hypothetical protein [Cystobacterineae bacterium]MCL2314056.1 hypothetical protein [Pseudomonadota bacterium]